MEIVSRKEASEKGLLKYFTGKPCKYGHISEREYPNGCCSECRRIHRETHSEEIKDYKKLHYLNNSERIKKKSADWVRDNPERAKESRKSWAQKNKDKVKVYIRNSCLKNYDRYREVRREFVRNNPGIINARTAKRRAAKLQRTPTWTDLEKIKLIYKECTRLTRETGVKYQVDHIIPLQGEFVSGLHVANNLQIITAEANAVKSNKFNIEQT